MVSAARDSANMACVLCIPMQMIMPYSGSAMAAVSSRERSRAETFHRSSRRNVRRMRVRT